MGCFSKEQLSHLYESDYDSQYDEEIRRIITCAKEYADKYQTSIPVVVAGGIMNENQVRHILELGADGIQVATPFVTTEECDAADAFKQAKECKGKPTAIIMKTIKGKGVSFMENQVSWHGSAPNDEQCKQALEELEKVGE